jgi:hypothetical protein
MRAFVTQLVTANGPTRRNFHQDPPIQEEPSVQVSASLEDDWGIHDPLPSDELVKANRHRLEALNHARAISTTIRPKDRKSKEINVELTPKVVKKRGPTVLLSPSASAKPRRK